MSGDGRATDGQPVRDLTYRKRCGTQGVQYLASDGIAEGI
jgi:hypothetical protein